MLAAEYLYGTASSSGWRAGFHLVDADAPFRRVGLGRDGGAVGVGCVADLVGGRRRRAGSACLRRPPCPPAMCCE
jgi:hypothetical protein